MKYLIFTITILFFSFSKVQPEPKLFFENTKYFDLTHIQLTDNEKINQFLFDNAPLYAETFVPKYRVFDKTVNCIKLYNKYTNLILQGLTADFCFIVSETSIEEVYFKINDINEESRTDFEFTNQYLRDSLDYFPIEKKELIMVNSRNGEESSFSDFTNDLKDMAKEKQISNQKNNTNVSKNKRNPIHRKTHHTNSTKTRYRKKFSISR